MTAPEIASLVTAAVALMGALTAYLHSRATRSMVAPPPTAAPTEPQTKPQSTM